MARTRLVNGKPVPLTTKEEVLRDAEELAYANAPPDPPRPPSERQRLDGLIAALKSKGIVTDTDLTAIGD